MYSWKEKKSHEFQPFNTIRLHPLLPGERNNNLLKVGSAFRYYGFSERDLEAVTQIIADNYGDKEYGLKQITQRLNWGYGKSMVKCQKDSKNGCVKVSKCHIGCV